MRPQLLRSLLEAISLEDNRSNLNGALQNPSDLLSERTLKRLDEKHDGIFAIILFNSAIDKDFSKYILSGSLASDVGKKLFVLYEVNKTSQNHIETQNLTEIILRPDDPITQFSREIFQHDEIELPGILFLTRLTGEQEAVYVKFGGVSGDATFQQIRHVFSISVESLRESDQFNPFHRLFGLKLSKIGRPYVSNKPISGGEKILKLLYVLWENRRDLIALVPTFVKLTSGRKIA